MNNVQILIFIAMIFCHIVDDYYLQGILAKLKQKQWWKENAPGKLYEKDYITALITHALSWSITISIPLIVYIFTNNIENGMGYVMCSIAVNMIIHSIVDNIKANRHKINLTIDQLIHLLQILLTFELFFALM